MFTPENTTLVVQGNIYENWTYPFLEEHKKYFKHIILSTWDNENVLNVDGVQVIKSSLPEIRGPGNVNCQLRSSLVGCQAASTDFIVKVRSDILINNPQSWLEFFSNLWKPNRIFVLGLSRYAYFYPRDQIFAGSRKDMINLFAIPFINSNYEPNLANYCPELHLGINYCARFSKNAEKFLENPSDYLLSSEPWNWIPPKNNLEVQEEWSKIGLDLLYPVSRNLSYSWYKKFPDGKYNYDNTWFAEYWHEEINLNKTVGAEIFMKWEIDLIRNVKTNSDYDDFDFVHSHSKGYNGSCPEFSVCNKENLEQYFLKIKDRCKSILEIGVCRNSQDSSTYVFLNNKNDDCVYVGIDLDDKSFLNNPNKNIYTIKNTSNDITGNMKYIHSLGVEKFDFIFIDGWHSINQVCIDWEYTHWLSDIGIVGFHDVSCHPGPTTFINALDTTRWNVITNCCPDDWGIGFAWKK